MRTSTFESFFFKLIVIFGLAASVSSCDKTADPTAIKVSSKAIAGTTPSNPGTGTTTPGTGTTTPGTGTTTTPGTGTTTPGTGTTTPGTGTTTPSPVNTNGDGGVAIGATGTIIFKINGTTYTLAKSSTDFTKYAVSTYLKGDAASPETTTVMAGQYVGKGAGISIDTNSSGTGTFKTFIVQLDLADGTTYVSTNTPIGFVNYSTYRLNSDGTVTTKGTFDMILYKFGSSTDESVRVGGSFNL